MWDYSNSRPSIFKSRITGSSGGERKVQTHSGAGITGSTRTNILSGYWKNTADEITSLTLTNAVSSTTDIRVIVYATLKDSTQEGWEFIEESSGTAVNLFSSPYTFTTNGDVDKEYRLDVEFTNQSGGNNIDLELNSDNGSNYVVQRLYNSAGSIATANSASQVQVLADYGGGSQDQKASFTIKAETGQKRIVTSSSSRISGTYRQAEQAYWWNNTVDNLTAIRLASYNSVTCDYTAKLYRKKPFMENPDTLNFELVEEVAVNGDFSGGHTFSGLTGDDVTLYKLTWDGTSVPAASINEMQINGDTTNHYVGQRVRSNNTTASAAVVTNPYLILNTIHNNEVAQSTMYLYPKSGEERPALWRFALDEDQIDIYAGWWPNTVDEITSIKIFSSNSSDVIGTLKLYKLI
jgi:hypothetical protein